MLCPFGGQKNHSYKYYFVILLFLEIKKSYIVGKISWVTGNSALVP